MPRSVRVEYEGAIYHVMSRGDRGERIFMDDRDRACFMETLGEACQRSGAVVYSYVLMGNHYHLLLGTPGGNLVKTMQWLQGTYTARFNARHRMRGHLFQGRYKAIPVDSDEPEYARVVSDYIHLNPARAGLLKGEELKGYVWSSFSSICKGSGMPEWLEGATVLWWHHWRIGKSRDRRAYESYLQKRALECLEEDTRKRQEEEWKPLRRGWYWGSGEFREKLEKMVSGVVGKRKRKSYQGAELKPHDEGEAQRILDRALECLEIDRESIRVMRKSDVRKQALAWLVKSNTVVGDEWICRALGMGDRSNISRAVGRFRKTKEKPVAALIKKLHICTD
ncbi:MAG: transposase [Terrimicrobiaceae bacterium]|nr:transposase [Terrimicrobiaceae bacterium]